MNIYLKCYTAVWMAMCAGAVMLCLLDRRSVVLLSRRYWAFLIKPWKLVTFAMAAGLMIGVAPYSGDYSWDYYDASFMSVLTFITSPWSVAVFYRYFRKEADGKQAFIAFCVWMFSVSWSFDLYMYMRDGFYPPNWLPNIYLSSLLYASAGLLWSLDWNTKLGVFMSFKEQNWPAKSEGLVFPRIFIAALPYMLAAVFLCGIVIYILRKEV